MMASSLKQQVCIHYSDLHLHNELVRTFAEGNLIVSDEDEQCFEKIFNRKAFDTDVIEYVVERFDKWPVRWLSVIQKPSVFAIALYKRKPTECYPFFPVMSKCVEKAKTFIAADFIDNSWKLSFILYCLDISVSFSVEIVSWYIDHCDPSYQYNAALNFALQKNNRQVVELLMANQLVVEGELHGAIDICIQNEIAPFDLVLTDSVIETTPQILFNACMARNCLVIRHIIDKVSVRDVKLAMLSSVSHGRLSSFKELCVRDIDVDDYVRLCLEMAYAHQYLDIAEFIRDRFDIH